MPPQVEVRKSAEKEVKKVEEVKRFERRRSIEKKKEKSPKVEEEPTVVEVKKVTKKKEEELVIVEEPQQQRRPVVSSPHSGFPTGLICRKYYEDRLMMSCAVELLCKVCAYLCRSGDKARLPSLTVAKNRPIKTSVSTYLHNDDNGFGC